MLEHCREEQDAWWDQGRIGATLHNALTYLNKADLPTARYVINKWGSELLLKAFDRAFPPVKTGKVKVRTRKRTKTAFNFIWQFPLDGEKWQSKTFKNVSLPKACSRMHAYLLRQGVDQHCYQARVDYEAFAKHLKKHVDVSDSDLAGFIC